MYTSPMLLECILYITAKKKKKQLIPVSYFINKNNVPNVY